MDFFPVFLRLDARQVLVVGGGEVVLFATTTPDIFIDLCRRDADRQSFIDGHDLVKLLDNREKSQRICLLTPDKTVIEQLQHNPTYSTRLLLVSAIDNQ
ncbi:TPA: hypothetical protein ACX6O7_000642 [Photobacterium damselae]